MSALSRRRFLQVSGALAAGAGLAACGGDDSGSGTGGSTGGAGGGGGKLTWWDHQAQLQPAKERIFKEFESSGGPTVEYTFNNPDKLGEALQIAKQSDQLPDVHSNAGLLIPPPQLIADGWLAPLELSDDAMKNLEGALIDGIHVFDGKVYAFPIFDYHVYSSVTWYNRDLVAQADLDPDAPPASYEDFRAAAKAVQDKTGKPGWIWNIGMTERIMAQVNDLAQAAGFEGLDGRLFRTGEYVYDSDEYLTVMEFLLSLKQDGLLAPGSEAWVDADARPRWAAGAAGYFFDGPWNPGVILMESDAASEMIGAAPILTPDGGAEISTYHDPQPGDYWLTPGSKQADAVNQLLSDYFTIPEYSVEVANTMSQPPRDLDAVDKSDAHPEYKKMVDWFQEQVYLAPNAVVKNIDVTKVQAETKLIEPNLGAIIQGAFTGDVKDVKAALKKLSDDRNAELERAVKEAQGKGVEVELDDHAFPNWQPGADFTPEMYS